MKKKGGKKFLLITGFITLSKKCIEINPEFKKCDLCKLQSSLIVPNYNDWEKSWNALILLGFFFRFIFPPLPHFNVAWCYQIVSNFSQNNAKLFGGLSSNVSRIIYKIFIYRVMRRVVNHLSRTQILPCNWNWNEGTLQPLGYGRYGYERSRLLAKGRRANYFCSRCHGLIMSKDIFLNSNRRNKLYMRSLC